jgi:hypothetical protein
MAKRIFPGGMVLAAALALILLPGTVRAQQKDRDSDRDKDHHSQQWTKRHRHTRAHARDSSEPSGWDRGRKTGWRNCAALPPGQAQKEGCRDDRAYRHRGERWQQASHRREEWREHHRDRDRDAKHDRDRDRGHHDRDHDHDHH